MRIEHDARAIARHDRFHGDVPFQSNPPNFDTTAALHRCKCGSPIRDAQHVARQIPGRHIVMHAAADIAKEASAKLRVRTIRIHHPERDSRNGERTVIRSRHRDTLTSRHRARAGNGTNARPRFLTSRLRVNCHQALRVAGERNGLVSCQK